VEDNAGDVVTVALQSLHLPVLVTGKAPQLYVFVISCGRKDFHCGMESNPIDAFFVAVNNVAHFDLGATVKLVGLAAGFAHRLFLEFCEVPDPDRLVEAATGDQGVLRMKSGTHDIVAMACENCDTHAILPVPNAHSLVI